MHCECETKKFTNPRDTFIGNLTPPSVGYYGKCREGAPFHLQKQIGTSFFKLTGILFSHPHNPTYAATETDTFHRVKPQRFATQLLFNTANKAGHSNTHSHYYAPLSSSWQWKSSTKLCRSRWAGSSADGLGCHAWTSWMCKTSRCAFGISCRTFSKNTLNLSSLGSIFPKHCPCSTQSTHSKSTVSCSLSAQERAKSTTAVSQSLA